MKERKSQIVHIKEIIDDMFAASALPIDLDDARIWKLWDGVVGETIAKHARPSRIKKGVLLIKVTDSVWVQELEFKAETIRENLNRKLQREAIKKIRFRVGTPQEHKQTSKKRSRHENDRTLTPKKQRNMEEILTRVKDKELRSSLHRIMIAAEKKRNV